MKDILSEIKQDKPLVHHITNNVTVNDCANITLYWGGLPVMAYAENEVAEMVEAASALVLNIGTLNDEQVEAMLTAGRKANELGVPVIFDPVGVGVTSLRTESALQILEELDIAVIKGNQGEISILAGADGKVKGVESVGKHESIVEDARKLAREENSVVVVSGAKDIVTEGNKIYKVTNGHSLLGQVVGTGCMLSSTLGVFCGVTNDYLEAALAAVTAYGIAGERASEKADKPASYKVTFLDTVTEISERDLLQNRRMSEE